MIKKKLLIWVIYLVIANLFYSGLLARKQTRSVTLSERNSTLQATLQHIKEQTGFTYFGESRFFSMAHTITIEVKNAPLTQVLNKIFSGQPVTYVLDGNSIAIINKNS